MYIDCSFTYLRCYPIVFEYVQSYLIRTIVWIYTLIIIFIYIYIYTYKFH